MGLSSYKIFKTDNIFISSPVWLPSAGCVYPLNLRTVAPQIEGLIGLSEKLMALWTRRGRPEPAWLRLSACPVEPRVIVSGGLKGYSMPPGLAAGCAGAPALASCRARVNPQRAARWPTFNYFGPLRTGRSGTWEGFMGRPGVMILEERV
jgi:hypothetical protein